MKELENIISELVSINRRLANNFKTEEGKELRADLFDITQKLEHYKQDQALQLQQTGVNGSFLYSIQILEKERNLIKECLSNWEKENYPEAKKEREQKLKDINNTLERLKK